MMQSSQVNDQDLATQLAQDYANRVHFLALFVLRDEPLAEKAVRASIQQIIQQRSRYWGQAPLRAWIYAQALTAIRHQMNLRWRFRHWVDRRSMLTRQADTSCSLRLELLRMESSLALPISLVFGHDLPEMEAAYVLGVSEDQFAQLLAQAHQKLPVHSQEELVQASRLSEIHPEVSEESGLPEPSETQSVPTQFKHKLLGHLLPDLDHQTRRGKLRQWITSLILVLLVGISIFVVGWSALTMESRNPEVITATKTQMPRIAIHTVEGTATPGVVVVAQATLQEKPLIKLTPTVEPSKNSLDLSKALEDAISGAGADITWENSGPVLFSVLLNYHAVEISTASLTALLRPNPLDVTIYPYEIENYISTQTQLNYLYRFGGDLEILRKMVRASLPVLLQKSYSGGGVDGWAAEYALVTGYDDFEQQVEILVARSGSVERQSLNYEDFLSAWLPFGYAYIVINPYQRTDDVKEILSGQFYSTINYESASAMLVQGWRSDRIDRFWESFAVATIWTYRQDYGQAMTIYSLEAFQQYEMLPKEQRPWRYLWYNSRPYWAFYYGGDYQRVITLADQTLEAAGNLGVEESLYWRAMAYHAMGEQSKALADLQTALRLHPDFGPALFLQETIQSAAP
ncbi:MAG: hypothetical protein MUC85_04170 [Anaerolineales bacterium]|nr:hypothetical protein [Anaerolineales bacterium]